MTAKKIKKENSTPKKKKKVEDLENKLKVALSDYQNLKKEMDNRLDFEEKMIRRSIIRDLIELSDDINMAMECKDEDGWKEGVTQILSKFHGVITGMGGEIMKVEEGDKFDSEKHEAVATTDKGEPGTISKIVQRGYLVGDMVVRPARVIVVK